MMDFLTKELDNAEADVNRLLGIDLEQQKHESALFIMRMKEIRKLPQTCINEIVNGCSSLFDSTVKRVRAGVRQKLSEIGTDPHIVDEVFDELKDPFIGLETEYL